MTLDPSRSQVLEGLGYTARQAQFLLLVALHGGYFLRRQYVAFTGRAHGQAAVRFLANTVARAHVRVLPYGRSSHVFHLCARRLYAAIGEEHNRNRRVAEWDAVMRKLMAVDFVLAHPTAQFWATEVDKVALLRQLRVPEDAWPTRHYAPKHPGGRATVRYFVDKMPWYRAEDDPRLWLAYIDAERTLHGFETFLGQYRTLLSSVPSGVTYVAPTAWRGAIEATLTRALAPGGAHAMTLTTVLDYLTVRREVEANRFAALSVAQLGRFRELRTEWATPAMQALYELWRVREDGSLAGSEVAVAARSGCALRVHALGRTYDAARTAGDADSVIRR
jgi:hypothetical protein